MWDRWAGDAGEAAAADHDPRAVGEEGIGVGLKRSAGSGGGRGGLPDCAMDLCPPMKEAGKAFHESEEREAGPAPTPGPSVAFECGAACEEALAAAEAGWPNGGMWLCESMGAACVSELVLWGAGEGGKLIGVCG